MEEGRLKMEDERLKTEDGKLKTEDEKQKKTTEAKIIPVTKVGLRNKGKKSF
jgi:hypothetical protein